MMWWKTTIQAAAILTALRSIMGQLTFNLSLPGGRTCCKGAQYMSGRAPQARRIRICRPRESRGQGLFHVPDCRGQSVILLFKSSMSWKCLIISVARTAPIIMYLTVSSRPSGIFNTQTHVTAFITSRSDELGRSPTLLCLHARRIQNFCENTYTFIHLQ